MNNDALFDAARALLGERCVDDEQGSTSLTFERCDDCHFVRYPPAPLCPECLSSRYSIAEDSGLGSIWSFCIYHRAFDPAFRSALPYNVTLIELDSGVRLISNVLDVEPHDLTIGMRVAAEPIEIVDGRRLIYFKPFRTESPL
jgi:uncharacterized OB-fold protein